MTTPADDHPGDAGRMGAGGSGAPVWAPTAQDQAFLRVYGRWDPLTPAETRDLMDGFPAPWWLVGGTAIEAFTGVPRVHEDVDLVIFAAHVPELRRHLGQRFHLWSNDGGTFIWLREHADAPWLVDCILNPSVGGLWQSKRDRAHIAPLEEVTWVAGDGVRYLDPAIVLHFKASHARPEDLVDLENAWPLLTAQQQRWLRDAVARSNPDSPWNGRLGDA